MKHVLITTGIVIFVLALNPSLGLAQPPDGEQYIVQADDWLSKIAEKEYGDPLAYTAIVEATNAKAAEDGSFAVILNPDIIEIGQKLWIPDSPDVTDFVQPGAFLPTSCETFGLGVDPGLECGYVVVPEFHDQPEGDTLQLAVVVIKATGNNPAPDPLFLENGGPGSPTISIVYSFFPLSADLQALAQDRDIVLVDQRGTQNSRPFLACLEEDAADTDEPKAIFQNCKTRLEQAGIDFNAYNTVQNANDMIAVADALGYEQINFYGVSYGSQLAQFVMRQHPDRLRSVIIDGVDPVNVDAFAWEPYAGSRAFRQLFATCAANPDCNADFPNLESSFFDLVNRLNDTPLVLGQKPDGSDITLSGNELVEYIYILLYQAPQDAQLPKIIHAATQNDFSTFELLATSSGSDPPTEALAMKQAVYCANPDYPADADFQIDPPFPGFEEALTRDGVAQYHCDVFDVERLPASVYEPVVSDSPTLVMNGQYDPIMPLPFGRWVAQYLSNAYVFEYPGAGHGALFYTNCPPSMLREFLNNPTQAPDDSCIARMGTNFVLPPLPIDQLTMTPITFDDIGVATVVPEQWSEFVDVASTYQQNYDPDGTQGVVVHLLADPRDASLANTLQLVKFPQSDIETAAGAMIPEDLATTRQETTVGNRTWTVFETDTDRLALTAEADDVYAVVLNSSPDQTEALFDKLWLPLLENFELTQ